MTIVFLAYTPLHLLISCGFALSESQNEEKRLIVVEDFLNAKKYIKLILKWKFNPFKKIYLFIGRKSYDDKLFIIKFLYFKKKIINIKKFWSKIKNNVPLKIYFFNDRHIESQYFLSKNKYIYSIYIEDGIESYYYSTAYISNRLIYILKKAALKFLLGYWYNRPNLNGTSRYINKMFSFYPELVVNELKLQYKNIERISSDLFFSLKKKGLCNQLNNIFEIESIELKNNCIILLPHSELFQMTNLNLNETKKILKRIIVSLENKFRKIYLKYHPREENYYIEYRNQKVTSINNSIALELILLLFNFDANSRLLLIGTISTAFITSRLILKDKLTLVSFSNILFKNKSNYSLKSQLFKKFNIFIPDSFSEFCKLIENIRSN